VTVASNFVTQQQHRDCQFEQVDSIHFSHQALVGPACTAIPLAHASKVTAFELARI